MILKTVNPYSEVGDQHVAGLDAIAASFGPTGVPTMDAFAQEIAKQVGTRYYPATPVPTNIRVELNSLTGHAINGYTNSLIKTDAAGYTTNTVQFYFVHKMLKSIMYMPINEISDAIVDIEDNITRTEGLSNEDQVPLLLATQIGKRNIEYWLPKIATPGDWAAFFDSNDAINTTNIPYWVAASMEGTLLLANRSRTYGLIDANSTPNPGVDIASALAGSLATGAGKVIFRMIKRITDEGRRDFSSCC